MRWLQLQRQRGRTHLRIPDERGEVDDGTIQNSKQQNGDAGEHDVEGGSTDVIHQSLSAETIVELVEEEHEGEGDVLVEGVLDEAREAVAGETAVDQKQAHQETELPNGVV